MKVKAMKTSLEPGPSRSRRVGFWALSLVSGIRTGKMRPRVLKFDWPLLMTMHGSAVLLLV